ncbi:MAG: hypothetical protein ACOVOW_11955 [Spirosomataceae bacterium]|nr:hypothetical protein [Flectobacillus sp.]
MYAQSKLPAGIEQISSLLFFIFLLVALYITFKIINNRKDK